MRYQLRYVRVPPTNVRGRRENHTQYGPARHIGGRAWRGVACSRHYGPVPVHPTAADEAAAWFGTPSHGTHNAARTSAPGMLASGLSDRTDDLRALEGSGRWAVCVDFEGAVTLARFEHWRPCDASTLSGSWRGPAPQAWSSSVSEGAYTEAVGDIRAAIARGDVYQANLCRVLSAVLPDPSSCDPLALLRQLLAGNPAPYAGAMRLPAVDSKPPLAVACASPELFLARDGEAVLSRPIKGTAKTSGGFLDKDVAENIMIVDLVRNDLSRVARTGSVHVPEFLAEEAHPGLVHLVSGVACDLAEGAGWPELFAATFPPGSVTGAPKSSALRIIDELEPVPRGPYCGAFGWVDADAGRAQLAVAIRTFWIEQTAPVGDAADAQVRPGAVVRFGTGAGITWGSDAASEWRETELKAATLVALASTGLRPEGTRC